MPHRQVNKLSSSPLTQTSLLVAVRREHASRYYTGLTSAGDYAIDIVSDGVSVLERLADQKRAFDVLVLDHGLQGAHELLLTLRRDHNSLLVILVDEEADFVVPGYADDISTEPFTENDLIRRIDRLMADRRLETISVSVPPIVRSFAKQLRKATGETGKHRAALSVCRELGFDYCAFYRPGENDRFGVLIAQDGPELLLANAPQHSTTGDIVTAVLHNAETQSITAETPDLHPLLKDGSLTELVCAPVGSGARYGVIVAGIAQPGALGSEQIMMLDLICAQLAAVLTTS